MKILINSLGICALFYFVKKVQSIDGIDSKIQWYQVDYVT